MEPRSALFREIHKNTWLKRLTPEGKRITIGAKKSERNWVVFCVHDDTEALLEGYVEPRMAVSHNPEWVINLQTTRHISHALVPVEQEYEFVITLASEMIRFHASSWEIMQEWVDTLRSKLREMKILSPKENLYTKLPEARLPLLPTRDPTSPLPATPPVPAAIVPGVECITSTHSVTASTSSTVQSGPNTAQGSDSSVSENMVERDANEFEEGEQIEIPSSVPLNNSVASSSLSTETNTTNTELVTNVHSSNDVNSSISSAESSQTRKPTSMLLNTPNDPMNESSADDTEECVASTSNSISHAVNLFSNNTTAISTPEQQKETNIEKLQNHSYGNSFSLLAGPSSIPSSSKLGLIQNSIRVDVNSSQENDSNTNTFSEPSSPIKLNPIIKRSPASRSISLNEAVSSSNIIKDNSLVELESTETLDVGDERNVSQHKDASTNITIIQVSTPLSHESSSRETFAFSPKVIESDYKSNVQIIPSTLNNILVKDNKPELIRTTSSSSSSNIGMNFSSIGSSIGNQYSSPVKKKFDKNSELNQITKVHVSGDNTTTSSSAQKSKNSIECSNAGNSKQSNSSYGKICQREPVKDSKKIILSANTSGITNISVNNDTSSTSQNSLPSSSVLTVGSFSQWSTGTHYEKVFLTSSTPLPPQTVNTKPVPSPRKFPTSLSTNVESCPPKNVPPRVRDKNLIVKESKTIGDNRNNSRIIPSTSEGSSSSVNVSISTTVIKGQRKLSPALSRKQSPKLLNETEENIPPVISPLPSSSSSQTSQLFTSAQSTKFERPILTRGVTEAVITARPSRIDMKSRRTPRTTGSKINSNITENQDQTERTRSESLENHRRSSSTSEVSNSRQRQQVQSQQAGVVTGSNNGETNRHRSVQQVSGAGQSIRVTPENPLLNSSKRLTLREQQVLQLRREIMHPGGVRLKLRRKDCIGSIAWIDAFGGVWVAGWKQKEHPMLYNALHIGDQLISIAGIAISSATEANKIIRNTNTLFLEILIRRVPFGRVYAIRREREGQCLGLIRDGNTATIVDVVPNSLAARHGLPPKAQSCDGLSLTFWVLTEINGRPLNLFFKENEVRDRLNSVGRDISILVQPSDLVMKLKKQLKSMRGYKDYIIQ